MTDDLIPAPSVSPEFVAGTERLARQIETAYPDSVAHQAHAKSLRASVAGLAPPPVPDSRSDAQRHYDDRYGDTTKLPSHLSAMLDRDRTPADAKSVKTQLEAIGRSYSEDLAAVSAVAGADRAKSLSANSLVQLALWAAMAARIAKHRPA
jgi:hypothetical protein